MGKFLDWFFAIALTAPSIGLIFAQPSPLAMLGASVALIWTIFAWFLMGMVYNDHLTKTLARERTQLEKMWKASK